MSPSVTKNIGNIVVSIFPDLTGYYSDNFRLFFRYIYKNCKLLILSWNLVAENVKIKKSREQHIS